jgi:small multidrug resistance family-3 protein
MHILIWPILLSPAALMEVGGDAVIRRGLRRQQLALVLLGFVIVGAYGVVVNLVRWDFSRLLGVYVAFFAAAAVLLGRVVFGEAVSASTWLGLALIIAGGAVIQLGEPN